MGDLGPQQELKAKLSSLIKLGETCHWPATSSSTIDFSTSLLQLRGI